MPSLLTRSVEPRHAKRIEHALVLLPVLAWLLFAWIGFARDISPAGRLDGSGHIKGHDFVHFFVLGQIALDRATPDLYSFDAQSARTDRLVPEYEDRFVPAHPPQVAMFFGPLASMPYPTALAIWWAASAMLYAACGYALWRRCAALHDRPATALLLFAAYPAFFAAIAAGQTSAFALAWFVGAWLALEHRRPWLAGLALGSLAYKPTLAVVFSLTLIYARQWKVIGGAAIAALAQLGAAFAYFGKDAILGYWTNLGVVLQSASLMEPDPRQLHSLRAFFTILIASPVVALWCYLIAATLVIVGVARHWRPNTPLDLRFAVLVLGTVLVDPHVFGYELLVLTPALALVANWAIATRRDSALFWTLWSACYFLPAVGAIASLTHLQLSTVALTALMIWTMAPGRQPLAARHLEGGRPNG